MRKKLLLVRLFAGVAISLVLVTSAVAQDAKVVVQNSIKAMGAAKTIQYSGTGHSATLGQALKAGGPWPKVNLLSYTRTIDYPTLSSKEQITRVEPAGLLGGGAPFGGEQKQFNFVSGVPPVLIATAGCGLLPCWAAEERHLQIWLTPGGFLKGASENPSTIKRRGTESEITFAVGKYKIAGTIDARGLVTKIETMMPNPVLGDMRVETSFLKYKDFGDLKFPTMIEQKQGGFATLDLVITEAKTNVVMDQTAAPGATRQLPTPPVQVQTQKIGEGLWSLGGGTHHSVVVEFPTYVAVIEAPVNEDRSLAVIAATKKLVPTKPIKYLINTHQHFDHSGGIRTYVAEGATIVTHASNESYYKEICTLPHTLSPDRLSQSAKPPAFLTVKEKYTMAEGARTLELHHMLNDQHNEGMLFVYFPKEKILVEADEYQPPAPNGPPPAPRAVMFSRNLYANLERLKLDVKTIAPIHGYVLPFEELKKLIGKT